MALKLPIGNTTTFVYNSKTKTDPKPTVYCVRYSKSGQHSEGFNLHYFLRAYRVLGGMTPEQKRAKAARNKKQFVPLWEPRWKSIWENELIYDPMVKPLITIIKDEIGRTSQLPRDIQSEVRSMKDENITEWVLATSYRRYSHKYIGQILESTRGLPVYPEFRRK